MDWLRTLAIGLLMVFHVLLSFQSWAAATGFPQNEELLPELVPLISMLSVWRIPLLFLISGMGVRFAMERRDWRQLLRDRTLRILVPYLFGMLVLWPTLWFVLPRVGWDADYAPNFGHLWFLLNIFLYVLWLVGLMIYLKDHPQNLLLRGVRRVIGWPLGLLLFGLPLMAEAALTRPEFFGVYIDNVHGWVLGFLCFFAGFLFISVQEDFWPAAVKTRWPASGLATVLFLLRWRFLGFDDEVTWLVGLECMAWMLAAVGFGALHLNRPSRALGYFSRAAYPVYIVHLPIQFFLAYYLLPLSLPAYAKLFLLLAGTVGVSLLVYEFPLRRVKWTRPLFGMKFVA